MTVLFVPVPVISTPELALPEMTLPATVCRVKAIPWGWFSPAVGAIA
ncbi:MAG TPA: hypothetical protein VM597_08640 [Gemmataceae bacterium]|nr:hypothetical protein [Gemmataceae bacterium]